MLLRITPFNIRDAAGTPISVTLLVSGEGGNCQNRLIKVKVIFVGSDGSTPFSKL